MVNVSTLRVGWNSRPFTLPRVLHRLTCWINLRYFIIDALRNLLVDPVAVLGITIIVEFHFALDLLQFFRLVQNLSEFTPVLNCLASGPCLNCLVINMVLLNCWQVTNDSRGSDSLFIIDFFLT